MRRGSPPTSNSCSTPYPNTVVANAKMKKELQEIENRILFLLSNSKGNILDDHELIETLASSKKTSTEITHKVRPLKLMSMNRSCPEFILVLCLTCSPPCIIFVVVNMVPLQHILLDTRAAHEHCRWRKLK